MHPSPYEYNKDKRTVVVRWEYPVKPYTSWEVQMYATNDKDWQRFRLTLKGCPTFKKLEMLRIRRASYCNVSTPPSLFPIRRIQVQLDNYINALKRGGQLNMKLEVVK